MPLYEMVKESTFRQDLLYRINTVEIYLPSLKERIEDIPLLAAHFLKVYSAKYRKSKVKLTSATIKKLQDYPWPGNVRELQHAIERTIIMSESSMLTPDDFFFLGSQNDDQSTTNDSYNLEEVERNLIQKAIQKSSGNISKAAKELGLTRASLYRRLEKHGL